MENLSEKDHFKFNETDTTTVIRRSHVRLDLQAAGLGPRPPSVISSDQEYPPLEHKDIPVPSPYAKKLQQNEEAVSQSNTECKIQTRYINTETKNHSNAAEAKINSASVEAVEPEMKIKFSNDGIYQKTASNMKNDQIKINIKEKIMKNMEEASNKRLNFVETEGKVDSMDKMTFSNTNRNQEASGLKLTAKESKDEEKYVAEVAKTEVSSNRKECIAAVNSVLMSRKSVENIEQPQTTWEQEKQKAELAKLRLSENYGQPVSSLAATAFSQKHSSKRSNEYSTSESSLNEDSDSSDMKTIVANPTECIDTVTTQVENNTSITTTEITETPSKTGGNHIILVTPDTMTPDEAENLLSSQ